MTRRPAFWLLLAGDLRALRRAPGQTLFTLTGICIAVALVVGVDLANDAARRGYDLGFARLNAGVSHAIVRAAGPLQDGDYVRLLRLWRDSRLPGVDALVPNVNGRLRLRDGVGPAAGRPLDVLGVDLLGDRGVRATSAQLQLLPQLIGEPGAVAAGRGSGLLAGHTYRFERGSGTPVTVQVRALFGNARDAPDPAAYRDLLVADIATAQELLGQVGYLSRIDLKLSCAAPPAPFERWFPGLAPARPLACAVALERALPAGFRLQSLAALRDDDLASGEAFYFNLGALSLLAAAVAALLVYQVVARGVNQRALDFGRLRALGMTGAELGARVVADYVVLATVAAAAGVVLGHWLATALVTHVATVVDDLFYRLTVTDLRWSWAGVGKGLCVALVVAVAASAGPAARLARTPVATLLRGELDRRARIAPWQVALGCAVLAVVLLAAGTAVWAALASIACLLLGAATAVGLALPRFKVALRGRHVVVPLALADLQRTGRDASLALGALLVAVATAFGMSWMISSFREALQDVLTERLQASVMVRLPAPLPDLQQRLAALPGVRAVALAAQGEVVVGGVRAPLRVADRPALEAARLGLVPGSLAAPNVAVSEPLARRLQLIVGEALTVGSCRLRVGGVFREYGNLRGRVVVARATAARCMPLPPAMEAELYGAVDIAAVRSSLLAVNGAQIADQKLIRTVALAIFDRTFVITGVVRLLALIVAAIALFASLSAWLEQRSAELGVLRALGLTGGELGAVLGLQSLLLGLTAIVLALPVGTAIAWVLVAQLQPRAFGWSFPLLLQWQVVAPTFFAALVAVVAGALLPALRLARAPAARWLASARHG